MATRDSPVEVLVDDERRQVLLACPDLSTGHLLKAPLTPPGLVKHRRDCDKSAHVGIAFLSVHEVPHKDVDPSTHAVDCDVMGCE